jgi:flagellar L-ring protein precursor FlgH
MTSEFTGDGETERKGNLTGKISAMVVEVLPSGILRIEGEKIVSLNSEEEIMVISGLVRPEDVNSKNEVDSSKVANVRIDYYGNGTIGDAQRGGWLGRVLRRWWPL